ncbi:MAG: replication initiation protein [Bacteroidota bacterium]
MGETLFLDEKTAPMVRTKSRTKAPALRHYDPKKIPQNVQQPYSLTAQLKKFDLNMYEFRVVVRILEQIKVDQIRNKQGLQLDFENNIEMTFPVQAFMIDGHRNYADIKHALISLREKTISRNVKFEVMVDNVLVQMDGEQFVGVIEQPVYAHNNSFVKLRLSEVWYKYLRDLTRGYTQYISNVAFNCSSMTAVHFYQYINHWFKKGGREEKWAKFRNDFDIPESYSTSKIISRLLEPTKAELDMMADRSFNYSLFYTDGSKYDPKKPIRGKRIGSIKFKFYNNTKNKKYYELSDYEHRQAEKWCKQLKSRYDLSDENIAIFYTLLKKYGYTPLWELEKERRKHLMKFTGREFIDEIGKIIRKERT